MTNLAVAVAQPAPPAPCMHSILLADEDAASRAFLADNLTADDYLVTVADGREQALALLSFSQPDLIILDVNGETLSLLDAIRSADGLASRIDPDTPLIALTGHAGELHRIRVLERGGDDVIAKPFSYPELRARVAAILRRSQPHATRVLRAGPLTLDARSRQVRVDGQLVELRSREYELLRTLASDPGRVFTREELLRDVWGYHTPTRTLDAHASRLRRKLQLAGAPALIQNVWGVGYRFYGPEPVR